MAAMMTLYTGGTLFLHDGIEFDKFMETIEARTDHEHAPGPAIALQTPRRSPVGGQ
jgi:hypothetical protein